ncbi:hypothetical protein ABKW07_18340 [Enterobacter kobei]|uniref:hypothetical protein n=1 Tax=Enterobacter kobei TaxID=208224 RepID=UPI0032AFEEC2
MTKLKSMHPRCASIPENPVQVTCGISTRLNLSTIPQMRLAKPARTEANSSHVGHP